jgi:hypothetical protein
VTVKQQTSVRIHSKVSEHQDHQAYAPLHIQACSSPALSLRSAAPSPCPNTRRHRFIESGCCCLPSWCSGAPLWVQALILCSSEPTWCFFRRSSIISQGARHVRSLVRRARLLLSSSGPDLRLLLDWAGLLLLLLRHHSYILGHVPFLASLSDNPCHRHDISNAPRD